MAKGIHTEETFEALIEAHLLEHGGLEDDRAGPCGHEDQKRSHPPRSPPRTAA